MEDTQLIADRIKAQAKSRDVKMKDVLEECQINKNFVNSLANGKDVGYQNLVTIADYLGCSVDFLLGRDNKNAPDEIRDDIVSLVYSLSDKKAKLLLDFLEGLISE